MSKEFLNIVDDDDNVIGIEDRTVIHEQGLLHREVHVYFITPDGKIIFQHRAKDKDTYPNLLDATVGGHVEIGDSYEETAFKEVLEETGQMVAVKDLIRLNKIHKTSHDKVTNKTNHAFQQEFVYIFRGTLAELKIEEGKALGFESWSVDDLFELDDIGKGRFIPYCLNYASTVLVEFVRNNLANNRID